MSHVVIIGAREIHGVRTLHDERVPGVEDHSYTAWHEEKIAKKRNQGHRIEIRDSATLAAYVNHGAWLVDCECGAGNATDREWKVALCVGCGARHPVTFPSSADAVEVELLKRPMINRNWRPGDTLKMLRTDNVTHGAGG